LGVLLKANYIFPDVAGRMADAIQKKNAGGAYAAASSGPAFSTALSKDLRELGDDKHFRAFYDPRFRDKPAGAPPVPSAAELAEQREDMARLAYGIGKIERLPGNVGYMEVRGFGPAEMVAPAFTAAMSLLAGSNALIIDLRRNGGGSPDSVAYLMSHFFPLGDQRHLNDIYDRPTNDTQQFWTLPSVGVRYDGPVYVLTSPRTFSGGEECAYDFQTQKRATLVGETTGGGANPGNRFSLGHGIVVNIPTGRAINPVTKTSWEHTGVKPDIAVPAAQALQTAHVAILRDLLKNSKDPEEREQLQRALALTEKGESEPPVYTMRQ
jgi:C-terminal processing protease CtpA/Prc